jgi:4-hydroxy-tetrahydrodipicolinate synthase
VPPRTSCNITLPVYRELAKHENIVAVKEASGNISQVAELIAECGEHFDVYSGNDDQIVPIMSLGGKGVISVLSNILPHTTQRMCSEYLDGNTKAALELQLKTLPITELLFSDVNPIPVKYVMSKMGLCLDGYRLPLVPPNDILKDKLDKILPSIIDK